MQNSNPLKTLFEKITTLHGISHVTLQRGKKLNLWLLLMLINATLTIAFIFVIKDRYYSDAIYTRINANCLVNQVPFPAVGICNFNQVSLKNIKNIERILKHYKIDDSRMELYFDALTYLKDYRIGSDKIESFKDITKILKHHHFTTESIMEEVHQKCHNLLKFCSFNRKVKDCENIFKLVKTVEGHCCLFNYVALSDASENSMLEHDLDVEYYQDYSEETKVTTNIIATSESGRTSGLLVLLDVEPEDYPPWSPLPYYGAKVIISDPNDYPETSAAYKLVGPGQSVDVQVEARVYQSEASLRRVALPVRRCWFHDEVSLVHTDRYSYETCNTECKMANFQHHCNCVPYKYPRLFKYQVPCVPLCYEECGDKSYEITSNSVPFVPEYYKLNLTKDINYTNLAALQVYFGKSTCNCYKVKLISDFTDLISNYGGILSLSFGGSILTVVELLSKLFTYLFTKLNAIFYKQE